MCIPGWLVCCLRVLIQARSSILFASVCMRVCVCVIAGVLVRLLFCQFVFLCCLSVVCDVCAFVCSCVVCVGVRVRVCVLFM